MPWKPPTDRSRPLAEPRPVSSAVTASAASSSDSQRLRRARRRPRRTIIDFHGTSSTTATPTTPWATATQRPDAVPAATALTPLANATSSATSRARLVIRGGGARITGLAPGARHPAIGYLPCHASEARSPLPRHQASAAVPQAGRVVVGVPASQLAVFPGTTPRFLLQPEIVA